MLGWEYPPIISGGLGIASQGLAKELSLSHQIDFLIPKIQKGHLQDINLIEAEGQFDPSLWKRSETIKEKLSFLEVGVKLLPYAPAKFFEQKKEASKTYKILSETEESELIRSIRLTGKYNDKLHAEISKYALIATQIAGRDTYDIVHGHDWMTFSAGKAVKEALGIPLVAHVHSTELDRNGSYTDPEIIRIEKEGCHAADHIIAVSHKVRSVLVNQYEVPQEKITVIPNGGFKRKEIKKSRKKFKKIGFVGRFTHQKGPLKFLDIARELVSDQNDIKFIMAGGGFLEEDIKTKIVQLNLSSKFELKGFIPKDEVDKLMSELDFLIIPSASEPFGLVALEALQNHTLVITTEGNGAGEFIPSLPQIPHWDIFTFCHTITELLNDPKKYQSLLSNCMDEAKDLTWKASALATFDVYKKIVK